MLCVTPSSRVTVFPAGKKQAKIALPACILIVEASDLGKGRDRLIQQVGEAISSGATGVLLEDSQGSGKDLHFNALLQFCSMYPSS